MKTTIAKIKSFNPCESSWKKAEKIIQELYPDVPYDQIYITPMDILNHMGVEDAVWTLRAFDYTDYCLFLADIAESVYPIYLKYNPKDQAVWNCIQAVHYFKNGMINAGQLSAAADAAHAAADAADAADAAARATYAAYAAYAAVRAARAAVRAAYAAYAADAAADAAYAAADATARAAHATYAEKWGEIKKLFIEHFGDNN